MSNAISQEIFSVNPIAANSMRRNLSGIIDAFIAIALFYLIVIYIPSLPFDNLLLLVLMKLHL